VGGLFGFDAISKSPQHVGCSRAADGSDDLGVGDDLLELDHIRSLLTGKLRT
jgi:hypothetical protein